MPHRRLIVPPGMETLLERFRYAPGVLVDDTLHIAGMVGRRPDLSVVEDTEAQFMQAFENVGAVLRAAGGSFADVIELETWFLRFPADLPLFMQVKDRFLTGPAYPTWTGFGVASFSTPGIVCEIKCIAVLNLTDA
ncbi:RidA family protein [Elioraea sp.]|uniref:RidA family protein n=1 Tax=Elioraea sp. TaxID=2185103 RepID=UPI003F71E2C6